MLLTGDSERRHELAGCSGTVRAAGERGPTFMITSDRRSTLRRPARTMLIAVLAGAAAVAPIAAPVALAATASANVVSAVPVDWHQGLHHSNGAIPNSPGSGYGPGETAVSSPATAAQSRGVVLINTELPYQDASGAGTGMVLTAAGQVLTSYHVVEGASMIKVTVAETGRTYQATVVGHDQTHDVALLQLKGA
ncbi:MAG TPA: trypsin-like peptidase domain-containing protein, partial [Propionibacteriaceae bacterium]